MKRFFKTAEEIERQLNALEKEMIDEETLSQYELEDEISRRASFFMPLFVAMPFSAAIWLIKHYRG